MASAAPAFPFTRETSYYARLCRLLIDVGSQVLRETFDRIHPPGTLHTVLGRPPAHTTLQALRTRRILNPLQWGKLYPAIKSSVSSKDFDITLLLVLLRNICGLAPPATGWDNLPPAPDVTPEADIARVKYYRNQVYGHASQASVDDATFSACWKDIRETLVRLGGARYASAIDDLKDECMDSDIEEHYRELLKQWNKDENSIKDKLDEMVEKLDELQASVATVVIKHTIESYVHGGVVVNLCNLRHPQMFQGVGESDEVIMVPITPEQEQTAEAHGSCSEETPRNAQEFPAETGIWNVILSFKESFNLFLQYLTDKLRVSVRSHDVGSLLITVECSSLKILNGLWDDYSSGHLSEVANKMLITTEVLEKLGLTEVKMNTFISDEEYEKGKQIFIQNSALSEQSCELDGSSRQVALQDVVSKSITGEQATSAEKEKHSNVGLPKPETSEFSQQLESRRGIKRVYGEAFGPGPSTSSLDESRCIDVMFICEEWVSSKGGLATFNREFAVNLAKTSSDKINVHCYVSKSNELDREDAKRNGVNLVTAMSIPGTSDPLDWLKFPPPELPHPDIVIGHGRKFGIPAYCIVRTTNCKWVQFVHVFCEDLGKYKQSDENRRSASNTIEENEKKHKSEVELCKAADVVVAVGSRLQQKYSRCLPGIEVQVITPGILENFSILSEKKLDEASPDEFSIFVFGRGSYEDLALKGYDIIADAIGCLGEKFKMTFVGSPEGEHRNIEDWFLQKTKITRRQVTIRSYCDQDELKMMFHESDLVALPSRTEGFGLVALEAISAGVPVLVTCESGIAKALEKVEGGKSVVVESEKPKEWSQKILQLSRQKPEERHGFAIQLRENYSKAYSWDAQCEKFKETMQHLTDRPPRTARLNDSTWGSGKNVGMMASFLAEYSGDATALANKTNLSGVKDNDKATSSLVENKGWNLLHAASQGGDVDIIESMLSRGLDINSRDSLGTTPLMVAAASGKMEAVDFLLVKGADPSLTTNIGRNLLHAAAEGGNLSIVETMLSKHIAVDSEDNDGITSLMIAASKNNLEIVDYLLGKGADPNLQSKKGRNVFLIAAEYGSIAVIERLLSCGLNIDSRDGEGNTPLMCAAALAKLETFNLILEKGADPLLKGKSGWSLLHFACQGGNVAIIETILSRGIDIDEIANSIGDLTPLVVTIVFNKLEAMKYLLDKGADPSLENSFRKVNSLHLATIGGNIDIIDAILSREFDINTPSSEGLTSLMFAAFTNNVAVVEYLLQKGADPALSDHLGRTCLHYASEGGDVTVIEKCLSVGVDVESKDNEGKTPLMLAAAKGNSDAVKYLLQRSAIPSQTGTAE